MIIFVVVSNGICMSSGIVHRVSSTAAVFAIAVSSLLLSGCSNADEAEVDRLNETSYAWHYRDLDSTQVYAQRALNASEGYDGGRAEALNNLAFVSIVKMDYDKAKQMIDNLDAVTDNQVELAIADIQLMRLCQRESRNKDFYDYRVRAQRRLRRIDEERGVLNQHQQRRLVYARSEFDIVSSTYFYYVGITDQSIAALKDIDPNGEILQDTAQTLYYYYNVGSGGIITEGTKSDINMSEFEYLMRCYMLADDGGYPYFKAQAMQGISEHLQQRQSRDEIIAANQPAILYLNADNMPDSLLAGNLALRALHIFQRYGDVYQIAGSYRTLSECYWSLRDYNSALICLQDALYKDTVINRAPDLVASIREQLSLAYSAINDKPNSDVNRNAYLDMQEQTRQDRQLEARADQLRRSSSQLTWMIVAVVAMIVIVVALLFVFDVMRKRNDKRYSIDVLLQPLRKWKEESDRRLAESEERREEIEEQTELEQMHVEQNRRLNLEQRAKISLVNSITPLIDRIIREVKMLQKGGEDDDVRRQRLDYIGELTDEINAYNTTLTNWIQLRQGELSLHIESFKVADLFNIIRKSSVGFQLKGITLNVSDTTAAVKADKTLTLFMINTLADNARKFTPKGGEVDISAKEEPDFVEISVKDNGVGMGSKQLEHLFDHKPITDEKGTVHGERSHGFGLMNCKGIIDKYRKVSQIFSVCSIGAESNAAGSRFWFRLPKGAVRLVIMLMVACGTNANAETAMQKAADFADSTYYSNLNGTYSRTLEYADSCIQYLNINYRLQRHGGRNIMKLYDANAYAPAELQWFHDGMDFDYNAILNMRNKVAVASLALHMWDLYAYNNKAYTQLFREKSTDASLGNYVYVMQKSESNKNVAIIILVLLLILIFPAYYLLYYRHRLYFRYNIERINKINEVLLGNAPAEEKIRLIDRIWNKKRLVPNSKFSSLDGLVGQIKDALQKGIDAQNAQKNSIEYAEDEQNRAQYESAKLHISNSVLDNCLSTLKHETMYYPSRIRQIIDTKPVDIRSLAEVVEYYKALYSILSAQAMRQISGPVRVDKSMIDYLLSTIKGIGGGQNLDVEAKERNEKYTILIVPLSNVDYDEKQCEQLFTPLTVNIKCLLCRQIVREIGEAANARACGILAERAEKGIKIKVIIPTNVWKSLK